VSREPHPNPIYQSSMYYSYTGIWADVTSDSNTYSYPVMGNGKVPYSPYVEKPKSKIADVDFVEEI